MRKVLYVSIAAAAVAALAVGSIAIAGAGKKNVSGDPMIGYQEVPAVSSGGTGSFHATIADDDTSFDWTLSYGGDFNGACDAVAHSLRPAVGRRRDRRVLLLEPRQRSGGHPAVSAAGTRGDRDDQRHWTAATWSASLRRRGSLRASSTSSSTRFAPAVRTRTSTRRRNPAERSAHRSTTTTSGTTSQAGSAGGHGSPATAGLPSLCGDSGDGVGDSRALDPHSGRKACARFCSCRSPLPRWRRSQSGRSRSPVPGRRVSGDPMIGYQEVPAVSTQASGSFHATISNDDTSFDWTVSYADLEGDVTQSHIHFGQPAVNGGITVFFCSNLGNGPGGHAAVPAGARDDHRHCDRCGCHRPHGARNRAGRVRGAARCDPRRTGLREHPFDEVARRGGPAQVNDDNQRLD